MMNDWQTTIGRVWQNGSRGAVGGQDPLKAGQSYQGRTLCGRWNGVFVPPMATRDVCRDDQRHDHHQLPSSFVRCQE